MTTDYPFCYDSADYKEPLGSAHDYHSNTKFIDRIETLFRYRPISMIDLGCANGSQVVEFIKRGHDAAGIDGSDYGVKNKTGGWGTNPDNFFNADLTKPFSLVKKIGSWVEHTFDLITAWDVLEHIAESDLPQFFQNIKNHTDQHSLCFFGIAMFPCGDYHRTVQNEQWWRNYLSADWKIYQDLMDWWTPEYYVSPCESPDRKFHVIVGPK